MSRTLLSGADGALQASHVDEVVFLEFDFLSGTSRACSREHSMEWNGVPWLGLGRVGMVEALAEGGELEARGIAMTLSGLTPGLLAAALTPSEYKGRAMRMWCGQLEEARYLSLPGSASNNANTTDSAALDLLTGNLDVIFKATLTDWSGADYQVFIAKGTVSDPSRVFALYTHIGTDQLEFYRSVAGSARFAAGADLSTGFVDGSTHWIRITHNAANGDVKFYKSDNYNPVDRSGTWVQIGSTKVIATGAVDTGNTALYIGTLTGADFLMGGKAYYAEIRNGIDGPVVAKFDASLMSPRQTSAQMPTGEIWTINQSGTPNAHIERDAAAIVADPVGPFLFKMDQLTYQLGQTATIRLTAESRLADWQRARVRRYNNADHQVLHPGDKFFEHVEKQVEAVHLW